MCMCVGRCVCMWMCTCVCGCMGWCPCVVDVCITAYICGCAWGCVCMIIDAHVYMCIWVDVCIYVWMCMRICVREHRCTCVCVRVGRCGACVCVCWCVQLCMCVSPQSNKQEQQTDDDQLPYCRSTIFGPLFLKTLQRYTTTVSQVIRSFRNLYGANPGLSPKRLWLWTVTFHSMCVIVYTRVCKGSQKQLATDEATEIVVINRGVRYV